MLVGTYEKVGISILAFSSLARCSISPAAWPLAGTDLY